MCIILTIIFFQWIYLIIFVLLLFSFSQQYLCYLCVLDVLFVELEEVFFFSLHCGARKGAEVLFRDLSTERKIMVRDISVRSHCSFFVKHDNVNVSA